jgi:hypothetical protein
MLQLPQHSTTQQCVEPCAVDADVHPTAVEFRMICTAATAEPAALTLNDILLCILLSSCVHTKLLSTCLLTLE